MQINLIKVLTHSYQNDKIMMCLMIRIYRGVNMNNLNDRQLEIINVLKKHDFLTPGNIHAFIGEEKYSRPTINRDLTLLLSLNLITTTGSGRSVTYRINLNPLLKEFNVDNYFKDDFRTNIVELFNHAIFDNLYNVFSANELEQIDTLNNIYKNKLLGQTTIGLKKELERLTIEFSWKSSSIEGNTYTLLETERLLNENVKAAGHTESEAQMIINHKNTLAFIIENPDYFKELSTFKISELHDLISSNLGINRGIRKTMVGIIGTNYRPLDNKYEIRESLELLVNVLNKLQNPVEKALLAVAMISYIQPFEDGNKRTARMVGNAILLANKFIPISFVGVDNIEYKKAIILFYEQNSIVYLKKIFLEQYELATNKYF